MRQKAIFFLKGNISCLLRKDREEYVGDLSMFNQKYRNICKYFDGAGLKEEHKVAFTKALVRCCHSFDQQLGHDGNVLSLTHQLKIGNNVF